MDLVLEPLERSDQPGLEKEKPRLIFSTETAGEHLFQLLTTNEVLPILAEQNYGLALAMVELSASQADVVRQLNEAGIYIVAWLLLPRSEGCQFNLRNYPQASECYQAFRTWARQHNLHFDAVGLAMAPPEADEKPMHQCYRWPVHRLVKKLWQAQENMLFPAARTAYTDLIAAMHHDGYEVHIYQLPLVADDRRAGMTLLQRALDVVDLPSDVEVLLCYSSPPAGGLENELGGTLIASYGPSADSIGIGSTSDGTIGCAGEGIQPLSWHALKRDLLLAATYTDTVYVFSLEGCAERGFLPRIVALEWDNEPAIPIGQQIQVEAMRSMLLVVLLLARFYRSLLAWLGWLLAFVLLLRHIRRRRK